jgi:hypothetical protein
MRKRVDRHGKPGPYGVRYSWVYWAAIAAAFALLIADLFDDRAIWNLGVVLFLIIAIAVRPGGVRGPRAAAADDLRRAHVADRLNGGKVAARLKRVPPGDAGAGQLAVVTHGPRREPSRARVLPDARKPTKPGPPSQRVRAKALGKHSRLTAGSATVRR